MNCQEFPLHPPRVVAIATDKSITPIAAFQDSTNLPGHAPKYGQDLTFGRGRAAPGKQSVGATPEVLISKMQKLLKTFASGDKAGVAKRLFDAFLSSAGVVRYFDDRALSEAAGRHVNIKYFCEAAVDVIQPRAWGRGGGRNAALPPKKKRIHQALQEAGWDVNKVIAPMDLGIPAFNEGSKYFTTGDFDNGLGLMVNGVQHVYVVARSYRYDRSSSTYCMALSYFFYDVFGLDDEDLRRFGVSPGKDSGSDAAVGITAWWQLQHQHGYAPLVTRFQVDKTFERAAM